jgi:DNA-binding LytR/AlgR family response regulator
MACLDSVEDSVEWLSNAPEPPDLIFLDIQLSDGSSFDIFEQITVAVPVIFTTAYNEYALQAFRVNSIDYLLKPIEEEALATALQKLSNLKDQFGGKNTPRFRANNSTTCCGSRGPTTKPAFLTTLGDRIRYVPVEQIAYFFAEDNTVYLVTQDRKKYVLDYTLDHLETLVDPKLFFRITRKYLTHIAAIGEVSRYFNSASRSAWCPPPTTKFSSAGCGCRASWPGWGRNDSARFSLYKWILAISWLSFGVRTSTLHVVIYSTHYGPVLAGR